MDPPAGGAAKGIEPSRTTKRAPFDRAWGRASVPLPKTPPRVADGKRIAA